MNYTRYLGQLLRITVASTVILGIIVGIAILLAGETEVGIDLTLEFGGLDGLWWMLGIPVFVLLLFIPLSPLSYFLYRLLSAIGQPSENPAPTDEISNDEFLGGDRI